MKIAILGGGNCHALALARVASAKGIRTYGIGRSPQKPAPLWLAPEDYQYVNAHIWEKHEQAFDCLDNLRPDVIVNFAAQGESAASFGTNAIAYYQMNSLALAAFAEQLRVMSWCPLFIHLSTSELYGACGSPANEENPLCPSSPYAVSKAAFDMHLAVMHRVHGFPMMIVRPSNCYVEGQQLHRIMPRAAISATYGTKLDLQGGSARKSYLHSDDLAEAILLLITEGHFGQIYNVGPAQPIAIADLVKAVFARGTLPYEYCVRQTLERFGEDSCYWLNSSKIERLGWAPKITMEEGIDRMLAWTRKFPELATMPSNFVLRP